MRSIVLAPTVGVMIGLSIVGVGLMPAAIASSSTQATTLAASAGR